MRTIKRGRCACAHLLLPGISSCLGPGSPFGLGIADCLLLSNDNLDSAYCVDSPEEAAVCLDDAFIDGGVKEDGILRVGAFSAARSQSVSSERRAAGNP